MRPVNSMIEFKQIIGRGTRLYEGKDYFTIHDFVKAHYHFSDPEWDGEPQAPEPPEPRNPRVSPPEPEVADTPEIEPYLPKRKAKVKLADGKARTIQHMSVTSFWHPDGTPMSALQFMEMLFGKLPEHFQDEAELKRIWGDPETRNKLLERLSESGFGRDQLREMQKIIDAESSDLYDVLAHVAYALPPLTRVDRADKAKQELPAHFNAKQQAFLAFVLEHYVIEGVDELDPKKIKTLLELKYQSLADAVTELGRPADIGKVFTGFQRYLYDWGA